jgi:hypothetical protein
MLICDELTPKVSRDNFRYTLYNICSQFTLKLISDPQFSAFYHLKTINGDLLKEEVTCTNNKSTSHVHVKQADIQNRGERHKLSIQRAISSVYNVKLEMKPYNTRQGR